MQELMSSIGNDMHTITVEEAMVGRTVDQAAKAVPPPSSACCAKGRCTRRRPPPPAARLRGAGGGGALGGLHGARAY